MKSNNKLQEKVAQDRAIANKAEAPTQDIRTPEEGQDDEARIASDKLFK